jgi:hypothetical protein
MPILFSSFPGLHIIRDLTPLTAAADTIDITGLNLEANKLYVLILYTEDDGGATSKISLYFNNDATATNYNSELVNPVLNVETAADANDAGIATLLDGCQISIFGHFFRRYDGYTFYSGQNVRQEDDGTPTTELASMITSNVYEPITQITLVVAGSSLFSPNSRLLLFESV